MGEIKQANFRIDEETAKKFRGFCEEMGMNQAQGFDHIMQVVELNRAKVGIEGRLTEITTFEEYVKKILDAYLNSLQIAQNTEDRVREEFKRDIILRDKSLTDSEQKILERDEKIARLTAEIQEAQKKAKEAEKTAENAIKQADSAKQIAEEKEKVNRMLSAKLAEAEEKMTGYNALNNAKEELQEQISKAKHEVDLLQSKLQTKNEQNTNLSNRLKDTERLLSEANHSVYELKAQISLLQRDVEEQKRTMEQKLAQQARENKQTQEITVERAIVNTQKNMQEEITKLRDEKIRLEVQIELIQKKAEQEN